jgi:hypothetical protein
MMKRVLGLPWRDAGWQDNPDSIQYMDPNPFKHPAIMLATLRAAIEPSLSAAGFRFDGRNDPRPGPSNYLFLDYARGNEIIRVAWDRRDSNRFIGFTAEFLYETGVNAVVATEALNGLSEIQKQGVTSAIQAHIDAFAKTVNDFLVGRRRALESESPT